MIDKSRLLDDLRKVRDRVGEPPTVGQYEELGRYSEATYSRRFGSWRRAKEIALGKAKLEKTRDEIIQDIRIADNDTLGTLTRKKYNHAGKYSSRTAKRVFDGESWTEIKKKALGNNG